MEEKIEPEKEIKTVKKSEKTRVVELLAENKSLDEIVTITGLSRKRVLNIRWGYNNKK